MTLASLHVAVSTQSLVLSTRGSTVHVETSSNLGLIVDSEPPQVCDELGVVSLEVWVVEEMERPSLTGVINDCMWINFLEAVQIHLADEAEEVGGFEGVSVVFRDEPGGQDLCLKQVLVDNDHRPLAVPANGSVSWVVHQTPQFGREIIRVDGARE